MSHTVDGFNLDHLIGREITKIYTSKMICNSCNHSFIVLKGGEQDCGECDKCAASYFNIVDGEPICQNDLYWNDWVKSVFGFGGDNCVTEKTLWILENLDKNEIEQHLEIKGGIE